MRFALAALTAALLLPMAAEAGYNVSSHKKESRAGGSKFNGGDALDSRPETAWMVDPEASNEGQWLELDVPVSKVDKISMIIGWAKSDDVFYDYARVKKARVEIFESQMDGLKPLSEQIIELEDKKERQTIDLEDVQVAGEIFGGKVKITILEVYPGKDYPNLAVSEMLVHLGEFDATFNVVGASSSEADHGQDLLGDGNARTFWASGEPGVGQSFVIEAPRFGVSSIGIAQGPKSYARPKDVTVSLGDMALSHVLEDKAGIQWVELPALIGYSGSGWGQVKVVIDSVYEGPTDHVAITDIKLNATNLEEF
jgi:ribosomal protein S19